MPRDTKLEVTDDHLLIFFRRRLALSVWPDYWGGKIAGKEYAQLTSLRGPSGLLGVYDWLRRSDGGLIGVAMDFHNERASLLLPKLGQPRLADLDYVTLSSDGKLEVLFGTHDKIDRENSLDGAFGNSALFRAADGELCMAVQLFMLRPGDEELLRTLPVDWIEPT